MLKLKMDLEAVLLRKTNALYQNNYKSKTQG